jgi:hypothetical protein
MSEPSKYGRALNALKQAGQADKQGRAISEVPSLPQAMLTPKAGRGGKRSNPDYAPTTFFVRKDTKRKAARLLEDMSATQDVSDLVQELLAEWVTNNSHV